MQPFCKFGECFLVNKIGCRLPIHGDAAEVHYAGRREEHIAAVVQVADELSEHPAAQNRERRFEGHREESDQNVRTR